MHWASKFDKCRKTLSFFTIAQNPTDKLLLTSQSERVKSSWFIPILLSTPVYSLCASAVQIMEHRRGLLIILLSWFSRTTRLSFLTSSHSDFTMKSKISIIKVAEQCCKNHIGACWEKNVKRTVKCNFLYFIELLS